MHMRIKKSDLLYDGLFVFILISNIISQYISIFAYFDEVIELICLVFLIYHCRSINKNEIIIFLILFGLLLIGLIGTIENSYQRSYLAVLKDIFLVIKFPLIMIALIVKVKNGGFEVNKKHITRIINIYTLILICCGVVSLFVDVGMSQNEDIRHGVVPFQFLYSHPTFLAYTLIFMSIVLLGNIDDRKKKFGTQIAILFLLILTMRDKAFAYVALYVVLIFVIPRGRKIKPIYLVGVGILAFLISFEKIKDYSNFVWSPRFEMYSTMVEIVKDNFPLGSGLASFGSNISGEYYSTLYYKYGTALKMGPNNYTAFNDAQWPYYFGQYGLLGGMAFLFILLMIYKAFRSIVKDNELKKLIYLMFGYMMVSSMVETFFANESGATIGFSILMFSGNLCKNLKEGTKYD